MQFIFFTGVFFFCKTTNIGKLPCKICIQLCIGIHFCKKVFLLIFTWFYLNTSSKCNETKSLVINSLMNSANSNSCFFLLSSSFFFFFLDDFFKTLPMFKLCLQHVTHVTNDTTWVCTGVRECVRVWWVCSCVCKCAQVCVQNEFSEYLLETRFLTSANYSTHPLRIFLLWL